MSNNLFFSLMALVALLPLGALAFARVESHPEIFWFSLVVAVAGPTLYVAALAMDGWPRGFSAALWVTVAGSMLVFALVCLVAPPARQLVLLVSGAMAGIALLAILWQPIEHPKAGGLDGFGIWAALHIFVSVATYAVLTNAAVAAMAVLVKEHAVRVRDGSRLAAMLPAIADAERIQRTLMKVAAVILAVGILTGLGLEFGSGINFMPLAHKHFFSILGLAVICALLLVDLRTGVRGRRAARFALVAWVLLTLSYPGVKFVTDVVLG